MAVFPVLVEYKTAAASATVPALLRLASGLSGDLRVHGLSVGSWQPGAVPCCLAVASTLRKSLPSRATEALRGKAVRQNCTGPWAKLW